MRKHTRFSEHRPDMAGIWWEQRKGPPCTLYRADRPHRNTLQELRWQSQSCVLEEEHAITTEIIRTTLKRSCNTVSGPDGIGYSEIDNLSDKSLEDLAREFNVSIQRGQINEEWLNNYLLPLPKPKPKQKEPLTDQRLRNHHHRDAEHSWQATGENCST